MTDFRAVLAQRDDEGRQSVRLTGMAREQLMDGDVAVRVERSGLNYKDGLALTGRAPIIRRWPMVPGIDLAGTVESSQDPAWRAGDPIVATGWGLGESHFGGLAEVARMPGGWLTRRPAELSAADAMAIGTAGFTAMLAVLRLEKAGLTPAKGPVIVTGAAGGVGSFAVSFLAHAGYTVAASTGRPEEGDYLSRLGASTIVPRQELEGAARPLARERWAAGIDSVGGATLANVLSMVAADGAVAACGNAGGMDLPGSVAPFILRGVTLMGINSVHVDARWRPAVWAAIAAALDAEKLAAMTRSIGLGEVFEAADQLMAGKVRGRIVVDVTR